MVERQAVDEQPPSVRFYLRRLPLRRVPPAIVFVLWTAPVLAQTAPAPAPPPPPETKVDASRGGITISSGVNSLTIGARAQIRWTLDAREEFDGDTAGPDVGDNDGAQSAFDVPRLRVSLSGGVFRPWMKYAFQFDFSRTSGEGASKIKDAILEIRPVGKAYRVQVGQFKAPFGLQQLTSSGRLQFVDRAITDAKFNPGRDMGVMVSGTAAGRTFGYDAGIFNGSGESLRQNNRSHLWALRGYVNPLGPYSPSESATDASDKGVMHLGVGIRGGKQIRGRSAAGVFDDPDNQTAYNVEFAYKRPRFYTTAEYFWMTDEQQVPTTGPDIDSRGFHAQAGVMPIPRKVEVGILFARVNGNTDVEDAELSELRGVVGYYFQAHNLKLQADVGQLGYGANFATMSSRARQGLPALGTRLVSGTNLNDTQVRVQLQLAF
jgi:phosphate-selective porin